jgi:hypothetical protein
VGRGACFNICPGFTLYLRFAPVPLQSGSLWSGESFFNFYRSEGVPRNPRRRINRFVLAVGQTGPQFAGEEITNKRKKEGEN